MMTRYGRHNIGFLWVLLEPVLFSLAIVALWSLIKAPTNPGMSVAGFALTGYASVLLWRYPTNRCTNALQTNWALLYHRVVAPLHIYAARIFMEVIAATGGCLALAAVLVSSGQMQSPSDPFGVALAWYLLILFATGIALTVGGLSVRSESFERVWHMLAYLLFPLSGPAFMVDWLPDMARDAVLILPMVHGVEMLRGAWFGDAVVTHGNATYLLVSSLVLVVTGLSLVNQNGRRVEAPA
jgi:capsular polysaccharide transport system permease protein